MINGDAGQFGEQLEGTKGKIREGREISGQSRARSQADLGGGGGGGLVWLRERERERERARERSREIERGVERSREEWSDRDTQRACRVSGVGAAKANASSHLSIEIPLSPLCKPFAVGPTKVVSGLQNRRTSKQLGCNWAAVCLRNAAQLQLPNRPI